MISDKTKIRSAATVIVVRNKHKNPSVLMGQSGVNAAFMPSKFVFPGGAVDDQDLSIDIKKSINEVCKNRLLKENENGAWSGLVAAAIREFFEETKYKIDFIRIHFPDPWPKKRHAKRRLITKDFLLTSYDLLKKGGSIEIITDSSIYQRHLEELISDQSYFKKIKDFPITCQISTFHKKAIEKGHTVKKYVLKKTS